MGEYMKLTRFNPTCHVLVIDPKVEKVHVTNTKGKLETTSSVAKKYGAKYAINADGWLTNDITPYYPLSIASSNGNVYQKQQLNFRPFLNVSQNGTIEITHKDYFNKLYNTASGSRYILTYRTKPLYLNGTKLQYREKHPRTAVGVRSDNKLVMVVVEGRSENSYGVTLSQLCDILLEFNTITGIDMDGGGSSSMCINGVLVNHPSDGKERPVVNHILAGEMLPVTKDIPFIRIHLVEQDINYAQVGGDM